ncbi:hypothetical protein EVAR_94681_1 [Eumeta japonica]|uniref:Uncharacterized protein n=1 Tax=Eumeta variegata TaxID=151549 RepID=A0A4C1UVI3_EUMVA|nr:hypothetical protein EVAR_94681_1 [Eumeta japonica]
MCPIKSLTLACAHISRATFLPLIASAEEKNRLRPTSADSWLRRAKISSPISRCRGEIIGSRLTFTGTGRRLVARGRRRRRHRARTMLHD